MTNFSFRKIVHRCIVCATQSNWVEYVILCFLVLPGSAEAQVIWGGIVKHLLIAYFIGNISAKKYQNPFMCIKVMARQTVGRFFRHSVDVACWYRQRSVVCRSVGLLRSWALQIEWTDRDAVWVMDSGGSMEPCITWGCTLEPPGKYDWTVSVWRRCSFCQLLFLTICW